MSPDSTTPVPSSRSSRSTRAICCGAGRSGRRRGAASAGHGCSRTAKEYGGQGPAASTRSVGVRVADVAHPRLELLLLGLLDQVGAVERHGAGSPVSCGSCAGSTRLATAARDRTAWTSSASRPTSATRRPRSSAWPCVVAGTRPRSSAPARLGLRGLDRRREDLDAPLRPAVDPVEDLHDVVVPLTQPVSYRLVVMEDRRQSQRRRGPQVGDQPHDLVVATGDLLQPREALQVALQRVLRELRERHVADDGVEPVAATTSRAPPTRP